MSVRTCQSKGAGLISHCKLPQDPLRKTNLSDSYAYEGSHPYTHTITHAFANAKSDAFANAHGYFYADTRGDGSSRYNGSRRQSNLYAYTYEGSHGGANANGDGG